MILTLAAVDDALITCSSEFLHERTIARKQLTHYRQRCAPRPGRGVAGRKERDWGLAKPVAQVSRWSGRHMPLAASSGAQRCVAHWPSQPPRRAGPRSQAIMTSSRFKYGRHHKLC